MRIIVVDDREEERYLAETLLEASGYEVETAANGVEALERLRAEGFDMIVSDILMPVMDGFQLCQECKKDEKLRDIPFVFHTATYKDEGDENLALKVGADRFVRKPSEPEDFVRIIQGLFRDVEEGRIGPKRRVMEEGTETLKLYSERLVAKLETKVAELEAVDALRKQALERAEYLHSVLGAIRGVNQLIVKEKDRQRLLNCSCDNVVRTRGFDSVWIVILDESGRLVTHAEAGLGEGFLPMVEQLERGVLPACCEQALTQASVAATVDPSSTCSGCPLDGKPCRKGVLAARLQHGEKAYGVLVASVPVEFVEDEEEHSLFQELAGDIAFALHDMELEEERKRAQERLEDAFIDLAQTVSRAMGARDPYTAGHQRRVAELARLAGERLGLDTDRLQGLYIGALLHDIGKISIPESLLTMPRKLTDAEWSLLQGHARQGYEILEEATLPWPVAEMALHHHERMDGSGYPDGISGEELTLEVRIIGVCDVVEAMGSHRPYRPARSRAEIMEELRAGRGTKYEPRVTDILLEMVESGVAELDSGPA